jgi:hypothetical protein
MAILDYPDTHIMLFIVSDPSNVVGTWGSECRLTVGIRWAITFLAQLHPLIEPRSSKLRPDIIHGDTF